MQSQWSQYDETKKRTVGVRNKFIVRGWFDEQANLPESPANKIKQVQNVMSSNFHFVNHCFLFLTSCFPFSIDFEIYRSTSQLP